MPMTYGAVRSTHFEMVPPSPFGIKRRKLKRHPKEANSAHAIITRTVARHDIQDVLDGKVSNVDLLQECREEIRGSAYGSPFITIGLWLIQMLLPIFLEWIKKEATNQKKTFGSTSGLNSDLQAWATESRP